MTPDADGPAVADPDEPASGPPTTRAAVDLASSGAGSADRRRVTAVAIVVGLVALGLGWILGRGSSAEDGGTAPAITVGGTDLARPIATVGPGDATGSAPTTGPSVTPPPSSGPPVSVIDASGSTITTVDVAGALAGQPIEIVAVGNGRRLLRLDVQSGRLTSSPLPGQPFGRARLVLGDDWILLPSAEPELPGTLIDAAGAEREWDVGEGFRLVDDGAGGLWRTPTEHPAHHLLAYEPITIDGVPTGPPIALPDVPVGTDPRGGFVVVAPGGTYSVGSAGSTRITTGSLLALGAEDALAEECDAVLTCRAVLIDRTTGDRRTVDIPERSSMGFVNGASISPDGGAAVVRTSRSPVSSAQPSLAVIDLASNDAVDVGPVQDVDLTTWTPDGRFALYISGGRLIAFDRATLTPAGVADGMIAIETFAVRAAP